MKHFYFAVISSVLTAVFALTGCSSAKVKTETERQVASVVAAEVNAANSSDLAAVSAIKGDKEVEEIDEISQMPKSDKDLNDDNDAVEQIPVEVNKLVVKWVSYFQGRGRSLMERYLARSARYLPMMKKILKDRGMPEDLVYIALIESGFTSRATSHAGAVGYWQFMRGTGRDYGLKINSHIDERRDPVFATQAAADYFNGLHNLFGSWYLAIASYNAGENKIKRLVMKHQTRDFWELIGKGRMPVETINYVPKYIAARLIAKHPAQFGFQNIDYAEPMQFEELKVSGIVSLRKLAQKMGLSYEQIKDLNPAFKTEFALAARGNEFNIRVPVGATQIAMESLDSSKVTNMRSVLVAARQDGPMFFRHRIRRGENLTQIAAKYGVSLAQIAKSNKLSPRSSLKAGSNLLIPQTATTLAAAQELRSAARRELSNANNRVHVVRRGDTLLRIAKRYRISMHSLASANKVSSRYRVMIGERLQIPD